MALPPNLKQINSFLKLAKEYDKRDPAVAYFCRMYAVQKGIKIDSKSPESKQFLFGLMDQLEVTKKNLSGDESVSNDIVAQAHVEGKAIDLFTWADGEDRKSIFNKNVTKAFYSSSLLFEVVTQFGELNDECKIQQKYAKWKASYLHKCLLNKETPIPGPEGYGAEDELNSLPTNQADPGLGNVSPNPVGFNLPYPSQPNIPPQQANPPPVINRPVPAPRASGFQNPPVQSTSADSNIDFDQAIKFCKFATSALQYEDTDAAVDNLMKALHELKR